MFKIYRLLIAAGLVVLVCHVLSAQSTPPLTTQIKAELVQSVGRLLEANYVYPDTARQMSAYLQAQYTKGVYKSITDPVVLSDALNRDMFHVYHDGHLLLQYNPSLAEALEQPSTMDEEDNNAPSARNINANFGFTAVQILNGNIGYINLEHFWADEVYGKLTVKAALQFVANSNALIIDLRTNGGGSPQTVALISSYFFKTRTHLNDSYNRATRQTASYWTSPDSSLTTLIDKPLYILTSSKTFSAAEEFAYNLQNLNRATIIGERTGGGAHNTFEQSAGNGFVLYIPYGKAINAITKTNWEKVGVKPHIEVSESLALETAEMKIFEQLIASAPDSSTRFDLYWQLDMLKAANHTTNIDEAILKTYVGVYGERVFTYENGHLYYQRTGRPKFELEAISQNLMKGKGNTYFKIEFIPDAKGQINTVKAYYQDARVEVSYRTD